MKVSQTREIEGRRIASQIGRIEVATSWHAPGNDEGGEGWKAQALAKLVQAAREFDADALVEVDFAIDGLKAEHFADRLERVWAKGVAVRLARG